MTMIHPTPRYMRQEFLSKLSEEDLNFFRESKDLTAELDPDGFVAVVGHLVKIIQASNEREAFCEELEDEFNTNVLDDWGAAMCVLRGLAKRRLLL